VLWKVASRSNSNILKLFLTTLITVVLSASTTARETAAVKINEFLIEETWQTTNRTLRVLCLIIGITEEKTFLAMKLFGRLTCTQL